jgi:hypothetical protein
MVKVEVAFSWKLEQVDHEGFIPSALNDKNVDSKWWKEERETWRTRDKCRRRRSNLDAFSCRRYGSHLEPQQPAVHRKILRRQGTRRIWFALLLRVFLLSLTLACPKLHARSRVKPQLRAAQSCSLAKRNTNNMDGRLGTYPAPFCIHNWPQIHDPRPLHLQMAKRTNGTGARPRYCCSLSLVYSPPRLRSFVLC